MDEPKLLFMASSMMERDALKARLESAGIMVVSPKRDISRKYTENTVDLSYGGYSAVFDGFKIFVEEKDFRLSQEILEDFMKTLKTESVEGKVEHQYLKKFHYFSVASVFVPLVPLLFGLYYFYKGIRNQEKPRVVYTIFSVILYLPQVGFYHMGIDKLKDLGFLQ